MPIKWPRKKVCVKAMTFFYNKDLLNRIVRKEDNFLRLSSGILRDVVVGDLVKFAGDEVGCVVRLLTIGPRDVNNNYAVTVELVKVVEGELKIRY